MNTTHNSPFPSFQSRTFFVPGFETQPAIGVEVYEGIRDNLPDEVASARIRRLDYRHDGIAYSARVGAEDERGQGTIFAIFGPSKLRGGMYYIATYNRGVFRGEAMYVGHEEVRKVFMFLAD
jgi:hypothetical protein